MISNHNRASSSFRIIEPKHNNQPQYQQAQQMPINLPHQIPILTINNNRMISSNSANNLMYHQISMMHQHNHQQQQHYNPYQQQQQQQHQHRVRNLSDTDSSYIPETTSESGISDLDMSEKCNCCPYGYHIDVDFVTFLQTLGGKNLNKQLKKIQRKRNERLQRSMEYVIDEVEKIRQMNGENIEYIDSNECDSSPYQMNTTNNQHHAYNNQFFRYNSRNPSPNISMPITATTTTTTSSSTPTSRQVLIPHTLKKTINKIDQQINEDHEIFKKSNGNLSINSDAARKLLIIERSKALAAARHKSSSLNNSINHSSSLPPPQEREQNYSHQYIRPSTAQSQHCSSNQIPRRSYSSCAEPFNQQLNQPVRQVIDARRCSSNRASPIRQKCNSYQKLDESYQMDSHRSRSANRRHSKSRSPIQQQFYRREIKINLNQSGELEEHHHMISNDQCEELKTITTTSMLQKPQSPMLGRQPVMSLNPTPLPTTCSEVQEEVLLNLFSCNNSGSISSESSESLVEFDDVETKLKINEVYEAKKPELEHKVETRRTNNHHNLFLEKKLIEMEKKLQRLPELEIKNNILLEEKQLLLKQLKNQLLHPAPVLAPTPVAQEPAKVYRSIGCNSAEMEFKRDAATECRVNTREVGVSKIDDVPKEEITKMQTIITKLREKLIEQTLIMQQQLIKPVTRDVAVMHVVDRVEEPIFKPELRDVAINHRTEIDDKELIEKHTIITNTYIKEIEILRIENAKLTSNLEELIKKHSKHVVTRGTHAQEQPILYSVGTNTKKNSTRDVQVMFTPKSRDVSLSTDRFYHTRDVGLMCTLGLAEQQEQMTELLEIKRKYELEVQERVKQIKSYRDVAIVCQLDHKEQRSVALGCNLDPVKEMRDVSLKCNLDEEFKKLRDVCIGVNLDIKELKDASINVNTIEPVKPIVKEKRDFSTYVLMEDLEKTQMAREIAAFKVVVPKVTRDVAISVDHKSRLMDDLLRNQSSSMETVKTFNRQINTETIKTKESSCDTSAFDTNYEFVKKETLELNNRLIAQKGDIEQEKIKLVEINNELRFKLKTLEEELFSEKTTITGLEEKLNTALIEQQKSHKETRSNSCNTFQDTNTAETNTTILNIRSIGTNSDYQGCEQCSDSNNKTTISVKSHINRSENASIIRTKTETEYEQHKLTRTGCNKVTQQETVSMKASLTDNSGDRLTEQTSYSTHSAKSYGSSSSPQLVRNQITIPIYKEDELVGSSSMLVVAQKFDEQESMSNIIDHFVVVQTNEPTENVSEVTPKEKKPKGILKLTSSSTASTGDESSFRLNDSVGSESQTTQKKALTFGENEIVEGSLQSEQSGSEFSLDESSQNNTVIANEFNEDDDDEEELNESQEVYETPITTIENITVETSMSDEESKSRRMKMERSNITDEMDDYELQEKLMMQYQNETTKKSDSKLKSSKHREFEKQQEDDTNDSNVQVAATVQIASKQILPVSAIKPQKNMSTISERFELELELHIACAILNDSLYEPLKADKNKVARALNLIQQDWFKLAAKKDSNPGLVEEHLNAFYSRFSNLLLERIVNMADLILNTALHYSVSNGNFEIVNLLLDTKVCDVNAQNKAGGYTSIMLAALVPITNDYERMTLKRLFAEGNVNIKSTDNGQTALMLAVMHGNKETVSLLLEAGSDCNLQDKEGSTALMAACEHGHIEIVRLLLDNSNCDPDIKDNDGETAFDISKKKKRNDIIVLLYAHSSKLRSHHPAIQFSKSRPRIGSAGSQK